jgi:ParB family chromosome partitioning protein
MSEQSNQITFIPLNKLGSSRLNARKSNRKADIDALAASIAAHGLLQNLNVIRMRCELPLFIPTFLGL